MRKQLLQLLRNRARVLRLLYFREVLHLQPSMELELISPWEIAKDKIQAIQDYTLLSIRALGNLFQNALEASARPNSKQHR